MIKIALIIGLGVLVGFVIGVLYIAYIANKPNNDIP